MTPPVEQRRVGAAEVCARLNVSRATLWRWCGDGRFPQAHYIGLRRAWWLADVLQWEREQLDRPAPKFPNKGSANFGKPGTAQLSGVK